MNVKAIWGACLCMGLASVPAQHVAAAAQRQPVSIESGGVALAATAQLEEYAGGVDVLAAARTGEAQPVRFLRTYYEVAKSGDLKRVASLFVPRMREGVLKRYATPQSLSEPFGQIKAVRVRGVLYWNDYTFVFVEHETNSNERETWIHVMQCASGTCQITDDQGATQLGGTILAAYLNRSQVSEPVVSNAATSTALSILPPRAAGAPPPAGAQNPIVLQLRPAAAPAAAQIGTALASFSEAVRQADPRQSTFDSLNHFYSNGTPDTVEVFQRTEVADYSYPAYMSWFSGKAPWTVSRIYALSANTHAVQLKSEKASSPHMLLLQRDGAGWKIVSQPSQYRAWSVLSSVSVYQALQNP